MVLPPAPGPTPTLPEPTRSVDTCDVAGRDSSFGDSLQRARLSTQEETNVRTKTRASSPSVSGKSEDSGPADWRETPVAESDAVLNVEETGTNPKDEAQETQATPVKQDAAVTAYTMVAAVLMPTMAIPTQPGIPADAFSCEVNPLSPAVVAPAVPAPHEQTAANSQTNTTSPASSLGIAGPLADPLQVNAVPTTPTAQTVALSNPVAPPVPVAPTVLDSALPALSEPIAPLAAAPVQPETAASTTKVAVPPVAQAASPVASTPSVNVVPANTQPVAPVRQDAPTVNQFVSAPHDMQAAMDALPRRPLEVQSTAPSPGVTPERTAVLSMPVLETSLPASYAPALEVATPLDRLGSLERTLTLGPEQILTPPAAGLSDITWQNVPASTKVHAALVASPPPVITALASPPATSAEVAVTDPTTQEVVIASNSANGKPESTSPGLNRSAVRDRPRSVEAVARAASFPAETAATPPDASPVSPGGQAQPVEAVSVVPAGRAEATPRISATTRQEVVPAQNAETPRRIEIIEQVTRHIESVRLTNGRGELSLSLRPDALGTIRVTVTQTEDGISARILTETAQAQNALEGGRDHLRAAFENRGLTLHTLDVAPNPNLAGHSNPQFGPRQEMPYSPLSYVGTARHSASPDEFGETSMVAEAAIRPRSDGGRLDYRA